MVMISSLQCFWQVWLSASLPELNSLHSMQSLQKDTWRGRLSTHQKLHGHRDSPLGQGLPGCWSGGCTPAPQGKSNFRAKHLHLKDGFILGVDSMKMQNSWQVWGLFAPWMSGAARQLLQNPSCLRSRQTALLLCASLRLMPWPPPSLGGRQSPPPPLLCSLQLTGPRCLQFRVQQNWDCHPFLQSGTALEMNGDMNLHEDSGSITCCFSAWDNLKLLSMGSERQQACLGLTYPDERAGSNSLAEKSPRNQRAATSEKSLPTPAMSTF